MNILTDPLPQSVYIGGKDYLINTDFTVGVRFELLMQQRDLSEQQRLLGALALYYPTLPPDLPAALDALLWFYRCGRADTAPLKHGEATKKTKSPQKAYCFEQDAELIVAAFWQAYGINLTAAQDLHWWVFRALFCALPAECELCKIMSYRLADTKGMDKRQKEHYAQMKRQFALKDEVDAAATLTLAERNQRLIDYVARRFGEAVDRT